MLNITLSPGTTFTVPEGVIVPFEPAVAEMVYSC